MRFFLRPLLYSVALCLALGYVTLRVQHSSYQVRRRLEESLSRVVAQPVEIEGAREPVFGTMTVRHLSLAPFPALEARTFLALEDLSIGEEGAMRVARAALHLEHQSADLLAGEPGRWNFEKLFRRDAIFAETDCLAREVQIDHLVFGYRELGAARSSVFWEGEARQTVIRPGPTGGIILEAELTGGEHWSEGSCDVLWLPSGAIEIRGHLENMRGLERWVSLLPEEYHRLWQNLKPTGRMTVDLEEATVSGEGLSKLRAVLRHYDTMVRLGRAGLEVKHLSGPVTVTEKGIVLGEAGRGESIAAMMWGMEARIVGTFAGEEGSLMLSLPPQGVQDSHILSLASPPGEVTLPARAASAAAFLRPEGVVSGELQVSFQKEGGEHWKGMFEFRDLSFLGIPCFSHGSGSLRFEGKPEESRGSLLVDSFLVLGLGRFEGELPFRWDGSELGVNFRDLRAAGEGAEAAGVAAMAGSVSGSLSWKREDDAREAELRCDIRWIGLAVSTYLFKAEEVGGSYQAEPGDGGGRGKAQWARTVVPASLFGGEGKELVFAGGTCAFHLGAGGVAVLLVKLVGDRSALRSQGWVSHGGEVELVVVLASGENYRFRDESLDGGGPKEWRDAAGASFQAFRVSGSLAKPFARPIGVLDPVFVSSKP